MLDLIRTRLPDIEAVSPELSAAKNELSDTEAKYSAAVAKIKAIRNEHEGRVIPPGSPMQRHRQSQSVRRRQGNPAL